MAEAPSKPKFPSAIPAPNPGRRAADLALDDDEKTDPGIRVPAQAASAAHSAAPKTATIHEERTSPGIQAPSPDSASAAHASASAPEVPFRPTTRPPVTAKMPEMGALESFMKDPAISEIMVNDLRGVLIEKDGKMVYSGFTYQSIDELNRLVRNILDVTGRILSPDQPYVDVMLPDGSRANIIGPPLAPWGPALTIRKFPTRRLAAKDLIAQGAMDQRMGYFLNVAVMGRLNILVCGGTGCGKTTLLNVLAGFIPKGERLVTIEDTPELAIGHFNSVRLQTKPQSPASPPITARDLVANALRMRPDRIIVGECRKSEALDMLQAMNTGHAGSMTTIHANSPRDALSRLETLCMMTGVELPLLAIRKQIVSAIDLIVQLKRFRDGKRRVIAISEVTGMEGETVTLQDIFVYETNPAAMAAGTSEGRYKATGLVPTCIDRLREYGIELPRNYFG